MFTGIVQGVATIELIVDRPGLRTFTLSFPSAFTQGLVIGASVSVDGVCLTVTKMQDTVSVSFDVMQQTTSLTTLGAVKQGDRINVERSAHAGAEVGGHPLSGHIDFTARLAQVREPQNNHVLRFAVPAPWMRYLFAKGYVAVNGASLTIAEAHRKRDGAGWFEVWLIPETVRMTTFSDKKKNDLVNVEVDRQTQIIVDTVRVVIDERMESLIRTDHAASVARASLTLRGSGTMAAKKAKRKSTKRKAREDGPTSGPHFKTPKKKK
jgi:riboflavin synthase